MDSLKHASNFLNELRTSSLNPKQYYELYILIYDGLTYLSNYLKDNYNSSKHKTNNYLIDLYELVQYAGNIIPRLYLMITVGSVYMSVEDAPINEILNDMLEMCKGVQNPIRGLFLRYYLIQQTKNYLLSGNNTNRGTGGNDGTGNEIATKKGTGDDGNKENLDKIINFIVKNFIEMNKLWVRLQHQGHSSEKSKRIEERNELKILVGSNLVIISQLDSINKQFYNEKILPEILQQIIKCNDSIAQNYLLDVIIQIFPDNFQIESLKIFLNSLLIVNSQNNKSNSIDITNLLESLIDRLYHYKLRNNEILNDTTFLKNFINFINKLNEINPNFNIKSYCLILNGILKLSLAFSNENNNEDILGYLSAIYKSSIDKFNLIKTLDVKDDNNSMDDFKIVLKSIENFENFENFFKINDENYFELFNLQNLNIKIEICLLILNNLLDDRIRISNVEDLNKILKYIDASILVSEKHVISDTKKDLFGETEDDLDGQTIEVENEEIDLRYEVLCKFLHLLHNRDSEVHYKLLIECENHLTRGYYNKTLPTLVSILIKLIRKMNFEKKDKKELVKIFNKISKLIDQFKTSLPIKSLNLTLNCAQLSNECNLNNITYDFFIESFIIFEELIVESKMQIQCLLNIINKLISMDQLILLNVEDFDKLITKATLYGSRLLKKTDQCRAIYNSSHLWWINRLTDDDTNVDDEEGTIREAEQVTLKKDDKRVLECLQKSLRIADSIMDNNVSIELFVEILNQSIYYFIHGNEMINVRYLNGLIELISNNFKEIGQSEGQLEGVYKVTWRHYQRTLKYIKEQRSVDARFHEIAI